MTTRLDRLLGKECILPKQILRAASCAEDAGRFVLVIVDKKYNLLGVLPAQRFSLGVALRLVPRGCYVALVEKRNAVVPTARDGWVDCELADELDKRDRGFVDHVLCNGRVYCSVRDAVRYGRVQIREYPTGKRRK